MARIFKRGELREALVVVVAALGEAHGYAIMKELEDRVGGGWRSSPGAIYPALVTLVDTGYLRTSDVDDSRVYALTDLGREAAERFSATSRWASLERRAEAAEDRVAVGMLLDRFASQSPSRRRLADPARRERIEQLLADAGRDIADVLNEGERDG